ncbi:36284_t:CDS:2, partial [Racocetra persica]
MSSTKHKKSKPTFTNKQKKAVIMHKENNSQLSQANLKQLKTIPLQKGRKHIIIEKAKQFTGLMNIPEEDASVDNDIINAAIPRLRKILKEYNLKDIYNMDETSLFY